MEQRDFIAPVAEMCLKKGGEIPLHDKRWRMNNLYRIKNEDGFTVRFQFNWAQGCLYDNIWYNNVVLKARQLGASTFIDLWILDECIFHPGLEAVIIADTKPHAEGLFRRKILFPFQNLPAVLGAKIEPEEGTKGSAGQLKLNNGSVISVGVSARSGTVQLLHISEFGKIAAKRPDVAQEIVTGSLQAAKSHKSIKWMESTAEGHGGYFYDYCEQARQTAQAIRSGTLDKLGPMDWKFFFFGWWQEPTYRLDGSPLQLNDEDAKYFSGTEMRVKAEMDTELTLDDEQKRWYLAKRRELKHDMKREFPATPDEAFEQSIEGAYFGELITRARKEGRVCDVPVSDGALVDTWWDLGMDDVTAIWFTQTIGREVHCIDYYEASGEGLPHFRDILTAKKYRYGRHVGPHDMAVRELGTGKSRLETAEGLGIRFEVVPRVGDKMDAIEAARTFLSLCWFDKTRCEKGLEHLSRYRKEWDDKRGTWKSSPLHDEHSNGADAFQTLAVGHRFGGTGFFGSDDSARAVVVSRKWGGA